MWLFLRTLWSLRPRRLMYTESVKVLTLLRPVPCKAITVKGRRFRESKQLKIS